MNAIDLTPFYQSSIGFDRMASLIERSLSSDANNTASPPYDIEVLNENNYCISLAVAGFKLEELDVKVEKSVLTVSGCKKASQERHFLHQGIPIRNFERKFNLAEYVEVVKADLNYGVLAITLIKNIPEERQVKKIKIIES